MSNLPWPRMGEHRALLLAVCAVLVTSIIVALPGPASADVDRTAVTSYDRMAPGAPHNGTFTSAWQSFVAESDTITTLGVTVGTPSYSPDGHTVLIRLCPDPTCSSILAAGTPQIANYGNSQVDVGDVSVSPGTIYYLVWYQPAPWNGQSWVTYWWGGGSTIGSSDQMQAVVRGYNRGTVVDRTGMTSYDRMQPGAPYNGYFQTAWQPFVAASNTITSLGVTVGTPGYVPDGHTVSCAPPGCPGFAVHTVEILERHDNEAGGEQRPAQLGDRQVSHPGPAGHPGSQVSEHEQPDPCAHEERGQKGQFRFIQPLERITHKECVRYTNFCRT
jgi:hypothetical protein